LNIKNLFIHIATIVVLLSVVLSKNLLFDNMEEVNEIEKVIDSESDEEQEELKEYDINICTQAINVFGLLIKENQQKKRYKEDLQDLNSFTLDFFSPPENIM
jgi:hypothetical protein